MIMPNSPNKEAIPLVEAVYLNAKKHLRELLPELPDDLELYVHDENIIPEKGVVGNAYKPNIIGVGVDVSFSDKDAQRASLANTLLHEAYHLVQGHTVFDAHAVRVTALDSAIYEGCATVFEREYGLDADVPWGDYSRSNTEELNSWKVALENIPHDEWVKGELWEQWSFFDPSDNQRWKAYKVGTWLVDRHIQTTGRDIRELRSDSAKDILAPLT